MRIALFHNLYAGGAKRALFEHARGLAERGHALEVFTYEGMEDGPLSLGPVVSRVHARPRPPGAGTKAERMFAFHPELSGQRRIAATIDRGGFDVAYVHGCVWNGVPDLVRFLGTPSVAYVQEPRFGQAMRIHNISGRVMRPRMKGRVMRAWWRIMNVYERRNGHAAGRILVNSRHMNRFVQEIWGLDSHVCYLGVDTRRFTPGTGERDGFVLSVGEIRPHKGFRFLVNGLGAMASETRPDLVLIGNAASPEESARLRELAAARGVRLTIKVGVDDDELLRHYRKAAVLVYTPHYEPFGLAPIEAMACGLPVLGVREGGVRETVVDGETGVLIDRNEGDLSGALTSLLGNRRRRLEMGRRAVEYVGRKWTWAGSIDRVEGHLTSVRA